MQFAKIWAPKKWMVSFSCIRFAIQRPFWKLLLRSQVSVNEQGPAELVGKTSVLGAPMEGLKQKARNGRRLDESGWIAMNCWWNAIKQYKIMTTCCCGMFTGVLRVVSYFSFWPNPPHCSRTCDKATQMLSKVDPLGLEKWMEILNGFQSKPTPRLERFHNGRWQLRFGDEVLSLAPEALDVRPDPQAHKDRSDASCGRSDS